MGETAISLWASQLIKTAISQCYRLRAVCAWIGDSEKIAAKHYLQVTREHHASALQNPVHHAAAPSNTKFYSKGFALA